MRNRYGFCGTCGWPGPERSYLTHVEHAIEHIAPDNHPSQRDRDRYERMTQDRIEKMQEQASRTVA